MKRNYLLILSLFLMFSCNGTSDISSSSVSENITTSFDYGKWGEDNYNSINEVMDPTFIPYIEAEAINSKVVTDEQTNINYVQIDFLGGFNLSTIENDYEALLVENGFTIIGNDGYPYGYKEYSITEDGVIQYELSSDTGVFTLICYVITSRTTEWPEYYIENICGYSIPKFETQTYECSLSYDKTNSNGYYLTMNCNKAGSEAISKYSSLLEQDGYVITKKDDLHYADNNEKEIEILFYYNDLTDDLFLKVMSISSWPVSDINFFLGESLPRFNNVPLSEYTYMTPSNKELLVLYFDGASEDCKDIYKGQLENAGWVMDEKDTENGYMLYKTINGIERSIQLTYGFIESLNIYSFVVAIY